MKTEAGRHGAVTKRPPTRAERRVAERAEARQRSAHKAGLPMLSIAGGVITILAVAAVLVYALIGMVHTNSTSALADPKALNPASSMLSTNEFAPNFTLKDTNGTTYTLQAQRGHPVLLEFFAVWCPVCQAEAPIMARLTKEYAPRGVRVWSVLSNPYGKNYELSGRSDLRLATKSDLSWYAGKFDVRHPQLIDPTFSAVNEYGISGYPGLYIVNPRGIISYAGDGHTGYARLAKALNIALATPGPPPTK